MTEDHIREKLLQLRWDETKAWTRRSVDAKSKYMSIEYKRQIKTNKQTKQKQNKTKQKQKKTKTKETNKKKIKEEEEKKKAENK